MASLARPCASSKLQASFLTEQRPKMLKEFLMEDNSFSSSNGFGAFYRTPSEHILQDEKLLRSRSRAASSTMFAIQKASGAIINAVKFLPFHSVKSPSVLPRSLSRKLSKWNCTRRQKSDVVLEVSGIVKVKDILRWRSFRDLEELRYPPLDFASSPPRCTSSTGTITTTTASASACTSTSTSVSSKSSSWCESDFTAEDLPCWGSQKWASKGEKFSASGVGGCGPEATMDLERELAYIEEEEHSPVTVLDIPFMEEDEESFTPLHQALAVIKRRKQKIIHNFLEFQSILVDLDSVVLEKWLSVEENSYCQQREEGRNETEGKVRKLLDHVKTMTSSESSLADVDNLIMDYFKHELETSRRQMEDVLIERAKAWMSGEYEESFRWDLENKRVAYIMDMERGVRWDKFEEEQEETAFKMETEITRNLLHELFNDLLDH